MKAALALAQSVGDKRCLVFAIFGFIYVLLEHDAMRSHLADAIRLIVGVKLFYHCTQYKHL